jgi:hypothetical protein
VLTECCAPEKGAVGPYVPIRFARWDERSTAWDAVAEHMARLYPGLSEV